jgi:hypothetical protein
MSFENLITTLVKALNSDVQELRRKVEEQDSRITELRSQVGRAFSSAGFKFDIIGQQSASRNTAGTTESETFPTTVPKDTASRFWKKE